MPEAVSFEARRHGWLFPYGIIACLDFGRRDVADWLQQPTIIEPVYPLQCRELNGLKAPPRAASMDDLGFVETIDRFGERIVVTVADTANRRLNARFGKALGIVDADVLRSSDGMVHQAPAMDGPPFVQGLLQRIENEVGVGRA